MIKPIFQSAQCRALGYKTNYLVTSTGNFRVKTDTVKGVIWEDLTPEDFVKKYIAQVSNLRV